MSEHQMSEKLVEILVGLKSDISNLSTRFDNLEGSVVDLKIAFKELIEIEKKQQRLEDNYKRLVDCCECINEIKMKLQELDKRIYDLEKHQQKIEDRGWKVFLSVIEKLIWWGLLLIVAYKDKIL